MLYLVLGRWNKLCGSEGIGECMITISCKCNFFAKSGNFPASEICLMPFSAEKWQIWVKLKSRCPINWGMGISENNPRKLSPFPTHVQNASKLSLAVGSKYKYLTWPSYLFRFCSLKSFNLLKAFLKWKGNR